MGSALVNPKKNASCLKPLFPSYPSTRTCFIFPALSQEAAGQGERRKLTYINVSYMTANGLCNLYFTLSHLMRFKIL